MAYVGNPVDTQNTFQSLVGKRFNGDGSTTDFTLDVAPGSTLDIEVFVGNVRQDPNSAYTLSGTTLTFTGAPPSGTNNIYVVHQAKSVGTIDPPATESTAKTFSGGVTLSGTTTHSGALNVTGAFNSVGIDDNGDATTMTIDSSENVNIGDATNRGFGPLQIGNTSNAQAYLQILSSTAGNIHFGDATSGDARFIGSIVYRHDDNAMKFNVNGSERMRVQSDGTFLLGTTSTDLNDASDEGIELDPDGTSEIATTGIPLNLNQSTADTGQRDLIQFNRNGSVPGAISATPSTVSYGTFMGVHWSRFSDNSKPTILEGTVMESIDEICDWYVAEFTADKPRRREIAKGSHSVGDDIKYTFNGVEYDAKVALEIDDERLPKSKVSDTEDSKKVYGVFHAWREGQVENDFSVASLGAYVVRMHKDETVVNGDYVQSKGDGTAKKQSDDVLRASTIGKITSSTKIKTYADGSYLVPCVLHCG